MVVRKRLMISGRVQGVFFRETCRRVALQHSVAGGARNLADGRVEVVLEGEADDVAAVENWCHEGPEWADVDSVEGIDEPVQGAVGFSTR